MPLHAASPSHAPSSLAEPLEGYVQGGADGLWLITTRQGLIRANQAYSCLIQPLLGDRVLLQPVTGQWWLLAILERQQPQPMQLKAPHGLDFDLAGQDCRWQNTGTWQLQAEATQVSTRHVELTTETGQVRGQQLTQHWQQVRSLIQDCWHSGQTLWQQLRQSISRVDEVEQKDCGHQIQRVRGSMTLHSAQGSITSSKDLRIDAERIHMG